MSDVIDIKAVRGQWVGVEFEQRTFEINGDKMLAWATACGETDPRFIDPDHPDFQAHPTFASHLLSRRAMPVGFPSLGAGFGIDGGKTVEMHGPIRAGDVLTGSATLADVFEKTGRSGTMFFTVQRMTFVNQHGVHVSTVDWKMIKGA